MITRDNPAGRLHFILDKARRHRHATIANVWMEMFGIDDTKDVHYMISMLNKLADDVEREICAIDGINRDLYLKNFSRIRKFLSITNLDTGLDGQRALLGEEVLTELAFCSDKLSSFNTEKIIEADKFEKIEKLIDDVKNLVEKEGVSPLLRKVILELSAIVYQHIREYDLRGANDLKILLERLIGNLYINRDLFEQNEEVKDGWLKVISEINAVTTFALNAFALTGGAYTLLKSVTLL